MLAANFETLLMTPLMYSIPVVWRLLCSLAAFSLTQDLVLLLIDLFIFFVGPAFYGSSVNIE